MFRYFKTAHVIALAVLTFGVADAMLHSASATKAAWVFAHRVNTTNAVEFANADQGINAIEIDVTHRADIRAGKRGNCTEQWCAFHSNDPGAENLFAILRLVPPSERLHAVWLDVKSDDRSRADYDALVRLVRTELGASNGRRAVKKFWGAYIAARDSNYTRAIRAGWQGLGNNRDNLMIFDMSGTMATLDIANRGKRLVNTHCRNWNMQCGMSAGIFNAGSVLSLDGKRMTMVEGTVGQHSHINSLFMWTFNSGSGKEDDVLRLLFGKRDYWERIAGTKWHCAQEGNGAIVGPATRIYRQDTCRTANENDVCSVAREAIRTGPNWLANRRANIGRPKIEYEHPSQDCP